MHKLRGLVLPLLFLSCVLVGSRALAQSSAALLVKPWETDQTAEGHFDGYLFSGGHTKETNDQFRLLSLESQGRVRLFPGNVASPRFGYDFLMLGTHTSHPGVPSELLDASVAAGAFVNESNGWVTGLTVGGGYAGDTPFARGSAWYPKADVVLAKKLSDTDAVGIGLDYDGNRTYGPDIPLPGFGYSHQFDPTLLLVVGAPVSSVTWKPIEHLRVHADYYLLTDLNIDVGYEFVKHWTVFGAFESRRDAFHVAGLGHDRRLLFLQRRIEAGIRFKPTDQLSFTLAGGYAFDGEYYSGFDFRKTRRVTGFSDEPFVRAGVELAF
jgi:hypothetical protein